MGAGLFATIFGLHSGPEVLVTNRTNEKAVVLIDGETVGKIRPGKSKSFDVERGMHLVELQNAQESFTDIKRQSNSHGAKWCPHKLLRPDRDQRRRDHRRVFPT